MNKTGSWRIVWAGIMFLGAVLACTFREVEDTPVPIPPTFTPDFTQTAVATAPSTTATPSPTITTSPSPTASPSLTPSLILPPSSTPHPPIALQYDISVQYEIDPVLQENLDGLWLAFTHVQNLSSTETETSQVQLQTVYVVNPATRERIKVIDLPASTEDRIYWSPSGKHLLYFLRPNELPAQPEGGLYILSLETSISTRLYAIDSLQPRGIAGHEPIWSPDGTQVVIALPTAYAVDIFIVRVNGTSFRSLTNTTTYNFFPAWSPDGKYLAFVSDRAFCSTWLPNVEGTCDAPNMAPPTSGNLYLYNFETQQTLKVNDTVLNAPPHWINERYIAVSSGGLDAFSEISNLWLYDIVAGSAWNVTLNDNVLHTNAAWNFDASQVIYQRIAETTTLVLADRLGVVQQTTADYIFPRFGVGIDWSPDGQYIAIGGQNGQCPYGLIVTDNTLRVITAPVENILACDPVYSPNGQYIAYEGTRSSLTNDGRVDIYIANPSGSGARGLTGDLEGRVEILGWVGTSP